LSAFVPASLDSIPPSRGPTQGSGSFPVANFYEKALFVKADVAAAAPAFAQTAEAVAGDVTQTQYSAVCQNVFDEIVAQGAQYGNIGDLEAGGNLAQSIAQE
jgi:hypothetical protein